MGNFAFRPAFTIASAFGMRLMPLREKYDQMRAGSVSAVLVHGIPAQL
jgi:hypothetical protein